MCTEKYFELWQMTAHFGEDFDLFGETVEEIVASCKQDLSADFIRNVILQIDEFKAENKENTDVAFVKTFGELGHVNMWGHTPASFLDELKRLLQK